MSQEEILDLIEDRKTAIEFYNNGDIESNFAIKVLERLINDIKNYE